MWRFAAELIATLRSYNLATRLRSEVSCLARRLNLGPSQRSPEERRSRKFAGLGTTSPSAVSETLRQINDSGAWNAGAGVFLIQRLEGSRFGTVVLWVLNGREDGESWRKPERIARRHRNQCAREGFAQPVNPAEADACTRVALMFESAAKS